MVTCWARAWEFCRQTLGCCVLPRKTFRGSLLCLPPSWFYSTKTLLHERKLERVLWFVRHRTNALEFLVLTYLGVNFNCYVNYVRNFLAPTWPQCNQPIPPSVSHSTTRKQPQAQGKEKLLIRVPPVLILASRPFSRCNKHSYVCVCAWVDREGHPNFAL